MKIRFFLALLAGLPLPLAAANNQLLSWNNLGMHCMDSDYSVFSILPPYNTVEAQLLVGGKLVTNGSGYTVTYQAVADPDGSFNSTAMGKGNYYTYATALYGAALAPEGGLASWAMPGTNNTSQAMLFEPTNHPAPSVATLVNWFRAEGIPITPYDDAHNKNPYPLMRLIARNAANQPIATNDTVLPVSDEMDCRMCHASGTQASAQPAAGWVWDGLPERDFRLNILRLHDEKNFSEHAGLYASALAARGFNSLGLYRGVVADGKPVLCATCHASEALGTGSYSNIPPLTASVHSKHATVMDPVLGITLDNSLNRASCYRCHPGSATKCLRGAMGGAIAADGAMAMQCQSCHGNMSAVGTPFPQRVGWFMEPNCQGCHTGTATSNNGKIRYTSCFETNGSVRVATNLTFATSPNTPAPGLSLYRFSAGHGGLQCSACHGSTHAEFPATHRNDNLRNEKIQGHAGMMVECTACHVSMTASTNNAAGGPHGMHPLGQTWVDNHPDLIERGAVTRAQCQTCHGATYRGTVLSHAQTTRTVTGKFGTKIFWRGQQIGCYDCHNGANSSNPSANIPATTSNLTTNTLNDSAVSMALSATDPNGNALTFRVVSQPANGSVGISNNIATYFPAAGFVGTETFTFAAHDTYADSNLGTGTVAVAQGPYALTIKAHVPTNYPAGWPAAFGVFAMPVNTTVPVTFLWDFGDGTAPSTNQFASHAFAMAGTYAWKVVAQVGAASATNTGGITINAPVGVAMTPVAGGALTLAWPQSLPDVVVEQADTLGAGAQWTVVTNLPVSGAGKQSLSLPMASDRKFFRVRQPW